MNNRRDRFGARFTTDFHSITDSLMPISSPGIQHFNIFSIFQDCVEDFLLVLAVGSNKLLFVVESDFGGHGQLIGGKGRGTLAKGKLVAWQT